MLEIQFLNPNSLKNIHASTQSNSSNIIRVVCIMLDKINGRFWEKLLKQFFNNSQWKSLEKIRLNGVKKSNRIIHSFFLISASDFFFDLASEVVLHDFTYCSKSEPHFQKKKNAF